MINWLQQENQDWSAVCGKRGEKHLPVCEWLCTFIWKWFVTTNCLWLYSNIATWQMWGNWLTDWLPVLSNWGTSRTQIKASSDNHVLAGSRFMDNERLWINSGPPTCHRPKAIKRQRQRMLYWLDTIDRCSFYCWFSNVTWCKNTDVFPANKLDICTHAGPVNESESIEVFKWANEGRMNVT